LAEPPVKSFRTPAAWATWLERHHGDEAGIWMKFAKKGTGATTITYAEALEVALCWGWIDSQAKSLDETYYLQRFTPRRKRSKWSKINRDAATRLIKAGTMKAPGLREVERAQEDGRWAAAYAGPSAATVPEDLERALRRNKAARDFFATLNSQNRYAFLYRIEEAKGPRHARGESRSSSRCSHAARSSTDAARHVQGQTLDMSPNDRWDMSHHASRSIISAANR
jgi:uncharacterized protein YdeI (YjbR/CyaY-like superfamily)